MSQPSVGSLPRIYPLAEIERISSSPRFEQNLIAAISDGFVSLSEGKFNSCPIQTMGAPPMAPFGVSSGDGDGYAAQTCVKSGYLTGDSHYIIKVASGGHPFSNSGLMQLYSQITGKLDAILMDEGVLTELRTAAVGAVAASLLAPKSTNKIGILGTGVQARYQLRMLKHVTDCRELLIWGRSEDKVEALIDETRAQGWQTKRAATPDDLMASCDLIVTTTSAREPLLGCNISSRTRRSQHITCIGADAPGKMELYPELVRAADLLVADSRTQAEERGEFEAATRNGTVSAVGIVELGELIKNSELHRKDGSDSRLTIFDSSGVAMQDCVIAKIVYNELSGAT